MTAPSRLRIARSAKPYAIERLESLKRGERLTYYRGTAKDLPDENSPRQYRELLSAVHRTADSLAARGRVLLQQIDVEVALSGTSRAVRLTDYIAIGL